MVGGDDRAPRWPGTEVDAVGHSGIVGATHGRGGNCLQHDCSQASGQERPELPEAPRSLGHANKSANLFRGDKPNSTADLEHLGILLHNDCAPTGDHHNGAILFAVGHLDRFPRTTKLLRRWSRFLYRSHVLYGDRTTPG